MEFTTHFGLRSQATRLQGGSRATRVRRHEGPYTLDGAKSHDHEDLGAETTAPALLASLTPHVPLHARAERIRRWAIPASLAVTRGILVSFFSSAY